MEKAKIKPNQQHKIEKSEDPPIQVDNPEENVDNISEKTIKLEEQL